MGVGGLGVHIFFVLLSFLLTMILDKKFHDLHKQKADPRRWGYALADYAVRRVLRVYPLFALLVLMVSLSFDQHKHQWYHVHKSILGRHYDTTKVFTFDSHYHFFILWTLPLELTYYLAIPIFVTGMIALQRWWWTPVLPLTCWIVYTGLFDRRTAFMGLTPHLPMFVCGSLTAIIFNRIDAAIKKSSFQFKTWPRLALRTLEAIVLLLMVSECFSAMIFYWFGPYPFNVRKSDHFVCMHVAILIVCEMLQPSALSSTFEWCVLRYAGKISFSVYLLHPRIIYSDFMNAQSHNYYTTFFSTWILVFFRGTISFHAVEQPCQRLAAWIGSKIKTLDAQARTMEHRPMFA